MKQKHATDTKPWYRQFWPWFLIALPLSAVIGSFFTLYLAISHPDPVLNKSWTKYELNKESPGTTPH